MHLGNVFSALLAWLSVRRAGGVMVLRMEDLDPDRCRAAYAEQLADDLRWLGLDWDEGYQKGGAHGPYLQSERTARYAAAFRALEEVVYSGKCRHLTEEERARLAQTRCPAWRLIVPDQEISLQMACRGRTGKTCSATAGTSFSAAPTGCTPTSWQWCVTTGTWGSPR